VNLQQFFNVLKPFLASSTCAFALWTFVIILMPEDNTCMRVKFPRYEENGVTELHVPLDERKRKTHSCFTCEDVVEGVCVLPCGGSSAFRRWISSRGDVQRWEAVITPMHK
jgi:hypothetical protein